MTEKKAIAERKRDIHVITARFRHPCHRGRRLRLCFRRKDLGRLTSTVALWRNRARQCKICYTAAAAGSSSIPLPVCDVKQEASFKRYRASRLFCLNI